MTGMVLLVCCGWTGLLCLSVQAYENLALHKSVWQNSTVLSFTADLAVDGQYTDLTYNGGQCAVSGWGQTTTEWRVDLGDVRSIHHIVIQYATGNRVWDENHPYTAYFLGFSVYISNTTNKEDGVLCFRDTNYTNATIPNPVNISCPYHGRNAIYYNNRTYPPYPEGYSMYAFSVLCEVEVYGCASPGYYGENCSLECPQNCQDGYCDIVEGTCFGCSHRYIGPRCTKDCPEGLYGCNCLKNCSMTCGDPGRCDIMTGHCNGGCQVGWTGAMCEKGYHSTINITHHEHVYIFETLCMSTIDGYLLYYKLMDNNLLCLPKKMIKIMLTAE
uniref:Platelet endothelial aggregation receptor 1-like isoform X1 n=1 Tax=Crassostrea virginica TaxID=6565 RepID=A0A8B8BQW3_CRAVI|nr:platelet endothelial aggregation receptor 1-like isoform X1 [Crassostrea virginica]